MSDDFSARLGLPYLAAGQMQKHVTVNGMVTRVDALLQTAVVSRITAIQPADPQDGDLFILPAGASGADWSARPEGALMRHEAGGWTRIAVNPGLTAVILDTAEVVVFLGGQWRPMGLLLGEAQNLSRLGVNTQADGDNPVAAKVNKMLFTALGAGEGGDGDLRLTLNKEAAGDVLSLLFQSGYGGRAELGLVGDDDLTLKVSADGGTWKRALSVDRGSGRVTFDAGAARIETTVFTADATWTPPPWARWIEVVAIGGGGGGGAGATGAAGTARGGGGGGGAGGLAEARWPADALGAGLSLVIGAGGIGATTGAGGAGGAGGDSRISLGADVLLTAGGGRGGNAGSAAAGTAGAGGTGLRVGNAGGAGAVTGVGGVGGSLTCPDGPGGGGGGGGLSTANAASAGGAGGPGGACVRRSSGGAGGSAAVGAVGAAVPTPELSLAGGGAGGGGASASGAGFAGGAAGAYGGGGGGGGAGLTSAGAGGKGAAGAIRLTVLG